MSWSYTVHGVLYQLTIISGVAHQHDAPQHAKVLTPVACSPRTHTIGPIFLDSLPFTNFGGVVGGRGQESSDNCDCERAIDANVVAFISTHSNPQLYTRQRHPNNVFTCAYPPAQILAKTLSVSSAGSYYIETHNPSPPQYCTPS